MEELRSNQHGWRYMKISWRLWLWHAEFLWSLMDEDDVILVFSPLVLLGSFGYFYRSQCFWFCVKVARIGRLRVVCPPSDGRLRKIDTFAKESIALWKHRNQEHRSNSRESVDLVDDFSAFVTFASKRHCTALSSFFEGAFFVLMRPSFPFPLASASWHHGIGIASLFP